MVTHIARAAFVPENLVSRDGFGSPVPRQPAHLHTQAETGVYVRVSSISAEAILNILLYKIFGVTVQIDHGDVLLIFPFEFSHNKLMPKSSPWPEGRKIKIHPPTINVIA